MFPQHTQFNCDIQRTAKPNKVDVFGTGIRLLGPADPNQAKT